MSPGPKTRTFELWISKSPTIGKLVGDWGNRKEIRREHVVLSRIHREKLWINPIRSSGVVEVLGDINSQML